MKNLFLFFILFISFYKYSFSNDRSSTIYAYVNGLVCDFCARALEKTIGKNDAVKSIKVDLKEKIITINFNENKKLEDSIIEQLIADAGYSVREITNEKK
tara:strand:+ start:69 stop:368 length:300 start_codon:yes stop_codon:yes gene_type:complete